MRQSNRPAIVLLLLLSAIAVGTTLAGGPTIEGLEVERDGGRVLVSFGIGGAFSDDLLERLQAGLPLEFRHTVEVQARRTVPFWFAKVIGKATVIDRVEYETLTRRYHLSREVVIARRGRRGSPTTGLVEESTESLDRVREFMTTVDELFVIDLLDVNRRSGLRLRVESSVGRRYVMLIFPSTVRAVAEVGLDP